MALIVCPAHAGVYPRRLWLASISVGLPRTRGGLPKGRNLYDDTWKFAPHTRGSTRYTIDPADFTLVCPAHAGVYRW